MPPKTNNVAVLPKDRPPQQKADAILRKLYQDSDVLLEKSGQLHVDEDKVVKAIADLVADIDVMIKVQVEEEQEIMRLRLKIEDNVKIQDLQQSDIDAREKTAQIIEAYVKEGNPQIQKSMDHLVLCRQREAELEVKLKSVSKLLQTNSTNMKVQRDKTSALAMEMLTQVRVAFAESNEHLNLHADFSSKMKNVIHSINVILLAKQNEAGNYASLQGVVQDMQAEIQASEKLSKKVSVHQPTEWPVKMKVAVVAKPKAWNPCIATHKSPKASIL